MAASGHEFQHPEGGSRLYPAAKGVGEGIHPGVPQVWIVVKGIAVQILKALVIVNAVGGKSGSVGGDRIAGVGFQDVRLNILEFDLALAGKPLKFQADGGVFVEIPYLRLGPRLYGIDWRMNLGETGVLLGPEDGAAAAVEGLDITVFLLQPCLEFLLAGGAGAAAGSLLGQLVVYLEACYVRIGAVVAADGRCDSGAGFPEFLMVVTAVAAAAKGAADTSRLS